MVETRGLNEKFWMDSGRHAPHGAAEGHRAPDADRLQHASLSGHHRRSRRVHPAVDDQRLHDSVEAWRECSSTSARSSTRAQNDVGSQEDVDNTRFFVP